ncbi:AMP-binding protein [Micromonospora sp. NPDC049903]|uniref:AMP-binding protein n=1 Tax=Micromonospora sp. NPDC049903 TaxID=3364276 RepID=UPI0037ADD629
MRGEPTTFAQAVWDRARRLPEDEVLRVPGHEVWTAGQLRYRAAVWAVALSDTVGRGDVVVTCVDAGPDAVALTAAVSALGAVELPLGHDLPEDWAHHLVATTAARVVVASAHRAQGPLPAQLARRVGRPLHLLDGEHRTLPADDPEAHSLSPAELSPTAPALIMATSGTTGRAKAALLPVGAPAGQARRVARAMKYGPDDVLLSFFPWQHVNARHASLLPAIISGARVVMAPRFSASGFLDLVRREQVTAFNFMGAVCMMLLAQPPTSRDRDHLLTKAYGGPAPARLVREFRQRFGVVLRQAYACTELGDVAATPVDDLRPGAAGRILPDHQVRIVDESGREVADGTAGEILVRPRRPEHGFLRYVGDAEATRRAWAGPWFRTRDRGRLVDGWLRVEGRLGDVIRRRGVNIDPQHVEDVLLAHPAVAGAAAVAVPSELTEDEVLAVVVPRDGSRVTAEELWSHCRASLPRALRPRYLTFEAALPYTGTHKLDRAALRRRGVPHGVWDADSAAPETTEMS